MLSLLGLGAVVLFFGDTEKLPEQNNTGTLKYGSLWTQEELDAMGKAGDNILTPKYSDEERFGGPAIVGFH